MENKIIGDKPWYMSKTVWAAVIVAAYGILLHFGVDMNQYKELIISLATALGIVGVRGALPGNK